MVSIAEELRDISRRVNEERQQELEKAAKEAYNLILKEARRYALGTGKYRLSFKWDLGDGVNTVNEDRPSIPYPKNGEEAHKILDMLSLELANSGFKILTKELDNSNPSKRGNQTCLIIDWS